jgi:hypothetical protein
MKRRRISKQDLLDVVAQKLQKASKYLAYGPLSEDSAPLRNEEGMVNTLATVMGVANNFYDRDRGFDPVADRIANFSGGDGGESYGNVSLVQTMGALDVTIMTLANSLIPFIAVDRPMANPTDTIYFNNLVAVNTAGGVSAGDELMNNFMPPNPNVNLGPATVSLNLTSTGTTSQTVNFSEYLVAGTVQVTLVRGGVTYTAQDFNKDGNLFFGGGLGVSGVVAYSTGLVTFSSGLANADAIVVNALLDTTADSTGTNILKVRSEHIASQLVSQPKQFIFEENEHANMYMNRIAAIAQKAGGITDYRELYFSRLTNMYIEDINRDLVKILVAIGAAVQTVTLDLSQYGSGAGFAMTKDDLISKFFINLRTDFISRTSVAATVCVVGTQGSALLESHATKWTPAPNFYSQLNGFIGTFNGVPIYRHNYLDTIQTAGFADFYMGAKLPDNSSGTMVFGEFLPLVQTATVGNVTNPLQKSTGWFSQVGIKAIQNTLVSHGKVTLGKY